jgi:hypothetical protein
MDTDSHIGVSGPRHRPRRIPLMEGDFRDRLNATITGFHTDEDGHWVAELACGHNQHVRHNPPWSDRPWVMTPGGREKALGRVLRCVKCESGAPPDRAR